MVRLKFVRCKHYCGNYRVTLLDWSFRAVSGTTGWLFAAKTTARLFQAFVSIATACLFGIEIARIRCLILCVVSKHFFLIRQNRTSTKLYFRVFKQNSHTTGNHEYPAEVLISTGSFQESIMTEFDWLHLTFSPSSYINHLVLNFDCSDPEFKRKMRLTAVAICWFSRCYVDVTGEDIRYTDNAELLADDSASALKVFKPDDAPLERLTPDTVFSALLHASEAAAIGAITTAQRNYDWPFERRWASRKPNDDQIEHAEVFREIWGNPFRFPEFKPEWRTREVLNLAESVYTQRLADRSFDPALMSILTDALEESGCPTATQVVFPVRVLVSGVNRKWSVHINDGKPSYGKDPAVFAHARRREAVSFAMQTYKVVSWEKYTRYWLGYGQGIRTAAHPVIEHLRNGETHFRGCWALDLIRGKTCTAAKSRG